MIFGDMWGIEMGEDLNLLLDVFNLIFCALEVDDLYRDRLLRAFVIPVRRAREIERVTRGTQGREGGGVTHPLYTSPNEPFPTRKISQRC